MPSCDINASSKDVETVCRERISGCRPWTSRVSGMLVFMWDPSKEPAPKVYAVVKACWRGGASKPVLLILPVLLLRISIFRISWSRFT